jgi:hypothetical protein
MRSARSSVDDAAGRSPFVSCARACVTSERVAGERWFSRAGGGGDGGWYGTGWPGDGWFDDGWPDGGCGVSREQAPSGIAAASAMQRFLNEQSS